jgi:hypothetical protein
MRGTCLCGNVEFELVDIRPKLYQCHCSLCRKQGGSASNAATIVGADSFRWISGQAGISSFVKATGFRSDFCANCGSPVPNPLRGTPYFWVPAGLLEDGETLKIVAHLHLASKAPWDIPGPADFHYETMPELAEIIEVLHADDTI